MNSQQKLMQLAIEQAQLAYSLGEVPVGAIVAIDDVVVSRAHNQVETHNDASLHAEIIALKEAAQKLGRWRLTDASLYVTMEPCTMCFGSIINFRIKNLFFGCYDKRHGAVGSLYNLSQSMSHIHNLNIYPEILAEESSTLVQRFFKEKRYPSYL